MIAIDWLDKTKKLAGTVILILIISLMPGCSRSGKFDRYDLMIANGEIDSVIDLYRTALNKDEENTEIRYRLADALLLKKNYKDAQEEVNKAIILEKQNDKYRLLAGKIAYHRQYYFDATNYLLTALLLNNRNIEAYYYLALTYRETEKIENALEQLKTAIGIEPMNYEARLLWCELTYENLVKSKQQADRDSFMTLGQQLKEALLIKPNSVTGNILLANIYQSANEIQFAKQLLLNLENRQVTDDKLFFELAAINFTMGRFGDTLTYLQKLNQPTLASKVLRLKTKIHLNPNLDHETDIEALVGEYPDSPELLAIEGEWRFKKGDLVAAEKSLQKSVNLNPRLAESYYGLSKVFQAQKDSFGTSWALSRAFELSPFNTKIRIDYIKQKLENGELSAAESALQHTSLNERDSEVVFLKALVARKKNDYEAAEKLLKYVRQFNYSADVEAELAAIEIGRDRVHLAEQRLKQAEVLFPGSLPIVLQKAAILEKKDQLEAVPKLLADYLQNPTGKGKVHFLVGEAYGRMGNLPEAIDVLEKGLETWPRNLELVQALSFYLGLVKRFDRAIEILEDIQSFNHRYKQLLFYRLKSYYYQSGKMERYRNYNDPDKPAR